MFALLTLIVILESIFSAVVLNGEVSVRSTVVVSPAGGSTGVSPLIRASLYNLNTILEITTLLLPVASLSFVKII